jgi:hypothetical protein
MDLGVLMSRHVADDPKRKKPLACTSGFYGLSEPFFLRYRREGRPSNGHYRLHFLPENGLSAVASRS